MLITLRAAIEKGIPLDDERLRSLLVAHARPYALGALAVVAALVDAFR